MIGIFIIIYLYLFTVLSSYYLFGDKSPIVDNPHSFIKVKDGCPACHVDDPAQNGKGGYKLVNFTRDIYSLCTSCHKPAVHHPIDIIPGKSFSKRLPLDPDGSMTCTTCHDPHADAYADKPKTGRSVISKLFDLTFPISGRKYPTYFLRMSNVAGKLCLECHERYALIEEKSIELPDLTNYISSRGCKKCHPEQYHIWQLTPHARMVRRPGQDKDVLIANLQTSDRIALSNIAYVLGGHWIQRFVSQKDDTFVVRTPIWIISSNRWDLSYWREFDWIKSCAGCHVTGLNPFIGNFAEPGVACEACHGPGKKHSRTRSPEDIVNPADLDEQRRVMICEGCHTTGHDKTGEFRYPVGFVPGKDLSRYFFGLQPKPGQDNASFKNDGSKEDRHRQFLFWLNRYIYTTNETCDLCKNFRFKGIKEKEKLSVDDYCRTCHRAGRMPIPHQGATPMDKRCIECHEPAMSNLGGYSIHDHKFVPDSALLR